MPRSLEDPALFINRDLAWLEFDQRVLDEALDSQVPILERLKFLAISASNLDEFFMVRVAGFKKQLADGNDEAGVDGLETGELLARISTRIHKLVADEYRVLREELIPGLAGIGLHIIPASRLNTEQRKHVAAHYLTQIYPALTPLAIMPEQPFPYLGNRKLNLMVSLSGKPDELGQPAHYAVVQIPTVLGRFVVVPHKENEQAHVLIEEVIAIHLADLFPGRSVLGVFTCRLTRDFCLNHSKKHSPDLINAVEKEVQRQDRPAVRLELVQGMDPKIERLLAAALHLEPADIYTVDGPLQLADFARLLSGAYPRSARDEAFTPQPVKRLREARSHFEAIAEGDILLHHPYESFEHVVNFIEEAASDPNVLAIKQTLYRTSGYWPVIKALARAAEAGKQVTALIELKARFDEENNILWARSLEESGVHVVHGFSGLKTHCKLTLVVRREGADIKRYLHLSTGNYNPTTARIYTDISFFTCREPFGDDATALFNMLTGHSLPVAWKRFVVAPLGLHDAILTIIEREIEHARLGNGGKIIAKLNALVDTEVIQALYRASQAGVKIDLLIRGICCLRPGIPAVSDNIRVHSIVDRFLEHSRIIYVHAGGKEEVYLSSADWMPRNFLRRVELLFPIEDPQLKARLRDEILRITLSDNMKASRLLADGSYQRLRGGAPPVSCQQRFIELARQNVAPLVERRLKPRPTDGARKT